MSNPPEWKLLLEQCRQLGDGMPRLRSVAWRTLVDNGLLLRGCRQALQDADGGALEDCYNEVDDPDVDPLPLQALKEGYADLSRDPASYVQVVRKLCNTSDDEAERLVATVRRLPAAAVVAWLLEHGKTVSDLNLGQDVHRWAYRAATLATDDPVPLEHWEGRHFDLPRARVGACFARLGGPEDAGAAAAQAAVAGFLKCLEPVRLFDRVPVLFMAGDRTGHVAHLAFRLLPGGRGAFFRAPTMFHPFEESWLESCDLAWREVSAGGGFERYDVEWELLAPSTEVATVAGGSAAAAFAVALTALRDRRAYDSACAISAALGPGGRLEHVEGIVDGVMPGAKLRVQSHHKIRRIVVPRTDFYSLSLPRLDSTGAKLYDGKDDDGLSVFQEVEVWPAETLVDAAQIVSSEASELLAYFGVLDQAPDAAAARPIYLDDHVPTKLYVEPNVLKRERKPDQLAGPGTLDARRGAAVEGEEPSGRIGPPAASEAEDLGEDLYRERRDETEQLVPWASERDDLRRRPERCAVLLGPPGGGKSLLMRMTAREIARLSSKGLQDQATSVAEVELPIVVPLDVLAGRAPTSGETVTEALRASLRDALVRQGCPQLGANYLAEHAHEQRTWLFLDALDEVGEGHRETLALYLDELLKNPEWRCRIVLTTRPYGYGLVTWPLPVIQYRLAPFSLDQAREFVSHWFEGTPKEAAMRRLLASSQAVQLLSQNPFLLTLLCWTAEREEQPQRLAAFTRTQLYERVLHDALGLPPNGRGPVDDDRADDWFRFLEALAWRDFEKNGGRSPLARADVRRALDDPELRPAPFGLTEEQASNFSVPEKRRRLLLEIQRKRLLIPTDGKNTAWVFPHRSFREFLTGRYLRSRLDPDGTGKLVLDGEAGVLWDTVDRMAWDPDCEEIVVFLASLLEGNARRYLLKLLVDELKGPNDA